MTDLGNPFDFDGLEAAAAKREEAGGQTIAAHRADSCSGGGFASPLGAADVTWRGRCPGRSVAAGRGQAFLPLA